MSNQLITGIHHITALASGAQDNFDFYAGILGLRLVKKTVNFDAPEVYHLYYGNETGSPGSIMTFFPFQGLSKGRKGKGQVTVTSFSIPAASLSYWMDRLKKFRVAFKEPKPRFLREEFIYFEDPDGLGIEMIASEDDGRVGYDGSPVPLQHAIKGFYGVTLAAGPAADTIHLLTTHMEHTWMGEENDRTRYSASGRPGDFIDIISGGQHGLSGSGTVHHIAFATADRNSQEMAREKLLAAGFHCTGVLNREYFHSVYFREPSGILFEIATIPPGFAVDESPAHLGEALKLPPWLEANRPGIEKQLPAIAADINKFLD
jgi:glyoxalase family protein